MTDTRSFKPVTTRFEETCCQCNGALLVRLALKTAEAAMLADAGDGLSAGMAFVDVGGRVVHANVSGHAMLAAGDFLRARSGRVAAVDPQSDRALREVWSPPERAMLRSGAKVSPSPSSLAQVSVTSLTSCR